MQQVNMKLESYKVAKDSDTVTTFQNLFNLKSQYRLLQVKNGAQNF